MAKSRENVPANLKWRTEDIFLTQADWEKTYAEVEAKLDFSAYEGKLADADMLLECLNKVNEAELDFSKLAVYASMKRDEDTRISEFTALQSRIELLGMKFSGAVAFMNPELTALPTAKLKELAADERFSDYDYTIRSVIRKKPHVLSKEMEALLAQGSKVFGGYQRVFGMLDNADFP
ncbi:MAG: hypothetical protein J6Q64_01880, partial [Clostridia bacterium]|nr:hypothetical protein [Clostridia bacterium]